MKKKETPFLDFYNLCMTTGHMTHEGLCICFAHDNRLYDVVRTFTPDEDDRRKYKVHYRSGDSYWASGNRFSSKFVFTPFRQWVVLFCAAINEEL